MIQSRAAAAELMAEDVVDDSVAHSEVAGMLSERLARRVVDDLLYTCHLCDAD